MDKRNLDKKLKFIDDYYKAANPASGSKYDSNSNVATKNLASLSCEVIKKDIIDLNRAITTKYIEQISDEGLAQQYLKDIDSHIIYRHDETSILPYCCSISLYPFLLNGLKGLGGSSDIPQHANSFIGGIINLVFLVSSQFAGAVAIPEFLTYFDHFLRKDYGDDYQDYLDHNFGTIGGNPITLRHMIEDWFQQFIYSINQPAGARNYQSPFVNIAYFDKYYFESIFKDFVFPDGDIPNWESTKKLEKMFMLWFNEERTKAPITFPVETANILVEDGKYKDEDMADFFAEMWSKGHSFFMYQSDSVDSLSSCCRLRNGVEENVFSYTLGAGGIETGSKCVITLNLNRIVQDWYNQGMLMPLEEYITKITNRVHIYLTAWDAKLRDDLENNMLPVYSAGFIDLDKQFLTVGVNGFLEAAEFLQQYSNHKYAGIEAEPFNQQYRDLCKDILGTIERLNREHKTKHIKLNLEFVPAENLASKNYQWDKKDGYWVPECRNLYNSYFYPVEDQSIDAVTKFFYQGEGFADICSGGVALHCNLENHLTKDQYRMLMDVAVKAGCNYFTYNIPNTLCNDCGHIDKRYLKKCPKCGSENIDYMTRIIGYLTRVSRWSTPRQIEAKKRYYDHIDAEEKIKY